MARTVIALYDDFASANAAVRELVDNGFSRDDVSIMANDAQGEYGRYIPGKEGIEPSATAQGAGVGAGIGAVIGGLAGLLVGLGALAIPGIGPVVAAGPLAAALTGLAGAGAGAVAGGVTGGLIGALVDMGVPEETAHYYAEGIRRGGTLVSIRTDDAMTDRAVDIMNRHDPVDINERVGQWRTTGWTGFDPNAQPYHHEDAGMPAQTPSESYQPRNMDVSQSNTAMNQGSNASMAGTGMTGQTSGTHPSEETSADVVSGTSYADFSTYDTDFRNHFATSYGTGYTYEQYQPAYRYGYDLATDPRFKGQDWAVVEPEARRYWDERNPGTWDRVKMAVQHAWDEVTS